MESSTVASDGSYGGNAAVERWPGRLRPLISGFRPHFHDWRFWLIQVLVVGIAAAHDIIEANGYLSHFQMLYFLPVSLFFLPTMYAAVTFGLAGAIATALLAVTITIPNWAFLHTGLGRFG